MYVRRAYGALLVASMIVVSANAALMPAPDIDKLTESSNLIVLGELVTVEEGIRTATVKINNAQVKVRVDRGTLRIDEGLRGTEQSPLVFDIVVPPQNIGWLTPPQQTYGMFFFRRDNGRITFTDPYYPYIDTPRGVRSQGSTALDRVVSILGEMLILPNSHNFNQRSLVFLKSSQSESTRVVLRAALDIVTDRQLRQGVAAGLLQRNDSSGLGFVKETFLAGPKISIDSFQENILGSAMANYLKDPKAIPDLEELLGAPSVHIRRGAAGALRGTQSPKAVNGLVRALEDADFKVRHWGVVGLAEITGQKQWRPNETLFKSDETSFLNHWKEWAHTRK
jgi:hypothetical protein